MKDRIIHYLANGVAPTQITSIVGCTESYISQIKAEKDYPTLLEAEQKKIKATKDEEEREEKYIRLESKAIAMAEENLPFAEFRDLTQLMQLLIQRRTKPAPSVLINNTDNSSRYVMLNVSSAVLPAEIVVNANKELIAVGDKSLAPMASSGVRKLFDRLGSAKAELSLPDIDVTKLKVMPEDF